MEPKILYSAKEIAEHVSSLARQIDEWYSPVGVCTPERPLLAIAILKGAVIFAADLVREMKTPLDIDFIRASSYGNATHTSGTVTIQHSSSISMERRHVLLIEDIVDSGWTINKLREYCMRNGASSVKIAALIDKTQRREADVVVDFPGMPAPDRFLYGYGMDATEHCRNLPDIWMQD